MSLPNTVGTSIAVVYGVPVGVGGLGIQSANAILDLSDHGAPVIAIGPGQGRMDVVPQGVTWRKLSTGVSSFAARYTWLRWLTGRYQYLNDRRLGTAASELIAKESPSVCYCFTQVALETLRWANQTKTPAILESPNGHLRNFREVYLRETRRLGSNRYFGHPTEAMVRRVEEEYARADVIRVSSAWAKESLVEFGVSPEKIMVIPQRPTSTFSPPPRRSPPIGRFRICFVGTLDMRKGFVYLLRAVRRFGPDRATVRLVGGTVDRFTRKLLAEERRGLDVEVLPGDPLPSLHWAELFVLPTLEDGSPFAVVEAMAAGLPLVVTQACGNASLIRLEQSGWVVPPADDIALTAALHQAYARRNELPAMGMAARADWEQLATQSNSQAISDLLEQAAKSRSIVRTPILKNNV